MVMICQFLLPVNSPSLFASQPPHSLFILPMRHNDLGLLRIGAVNRFAIMPKPPIWQSGSMRLRFPASHGSPASRSETPQNVCRVPCRVLVALLVTLRGFTACQFYQNALSRR
jgi:hypothetical protein